MAHPRVAGPSPGAAQRGWGRRLLSPRGSGRGWRGLRVVSHCQAQLEPEALSTSGELCPVLASSVQERQEAMGEGPVEATKNDEGSGTSSLWGETVGARAVQSTDD